jgi:hypothetical protein
LWEWKPRDPEAELEALDRSIKTMGEAQKLAEQGFELVCQIDGATLFRKRK